MHRCLKIFFIALFALTQAMPGTPVVLAGEGAGLQLGEKLSDLTPSRFQSGSFERGLQMAQNEESVDVEPPLIEHEVVDEAEVDRRQTFVATVVDDQELDSVVLYYRFAGESNFTRYVMTQVSYSSTYIAQIPTDPLSNSAIEYYIQARDTSGNRTVRGYTFSPLVRNIVFPETIPPSASEQAEASEASVETSSQGKIPKFVYILGGVLLVGLIVGASDSSDVDPPVGGGECGSDGCRVVLTVDQPY